jgi:hypothetical protein
MNANQNNNRLAVDDRLEAHREIIRLKLDEIAAEVEAALRDANLSFPIYLAIPNKGGALITLATSLDPPDADWAQASDIVCGLLGGKLGGVKLGSRSLQCSAATTKVDAADVTPHPSRE